MSTRVKQFLEALAQPSALSRGDLVVVHPPLPTLAELAAEINADYADLGSAALTAVEKAINIGKKLNEAKERLSHGNFTGYVTSNFPFAMRWGQQCRKLANNEPEIRQRLEELRGIGSHLSLAEAFKLIGSLNPRPKLRRKRSKAN